MGERQERRVLCMHPPLRSSLRRNREPVDESQEAGRELAISIPLHAGGPAAIIVGLGRAEEAPVAA